MINDLSNQKQSMESSNSVEERRSSHTIAVRDFDGQVSVFEADEMRVCVPTKACVQFWATVLACFLLVVTGIVFMSVYPPATVKFNIGQTMAATGTGILLPGPNYSKVLPKKK